MWTPGKTIGSGHRRYPVIIVAAVMLLSPTTYAKDAQPDSMVAGKLQTGSPYHLIICGHSGTFDLDVNARTGTLIEVPGGIVNRAWPESPGFDFHDDEDNNKVYFTARATTPPGTETSIRFWLASGREATIHASVVEHTRGIEDNVLLYHQSEREALGLAHEPNPCEPRAEHTLNRLIARATERHRHEPVTRALPVVEHVARSGTAPGISILLAEWEDDDMVVDFEVENPDFQPSRLTGIEVLDRHGDQLDAGLLYPRVESTSAIVDGHSSITGSILLPGAISRDVGSMELRFHGFKGASPYFASVKVVRFRPVTDEETEREIRAKQVSLGVRAIFGGFWMDLGEPLMPQGLDGTTVAGIGVRIQKGYRSGFALEGEIAMGKTGDARFQDVSWNGMTGDIKRSATVGRAGGGVAVRFGHDYVFTGRVGVGVQLASYDSTMDVGGTLMDGPGDGIEVDGLFSVGAGFDARLGEHWTFGLGANFSKFFSTAARSLEAGIHLGYGWGGSSDH